MKKASSSEERFEVSKLANAISNGAAANRLGIKLDTLYTWITKTKNGKTGFSEGPGNSPLTEPKRLKQIEKELREAREEIVTLQDHLFFCKTPKEIAKISNGLHFQPSEPMAYRHPLSRSWCQ